MHAYTGMAGERANTNYLSRSVGSFELTRPSELTRPFETHFPFTKERGFFLQKKGDSFYIRKGILFTKETRSGLLGPFTFGLTRPFELARLFSAKEPYRHWAIKNWVFPPPPRKKKHMVSYPDP